MDRFEWGAVLSALVTGLGVFGWLGGFLPRDTAWRLWALGGLATTIYVFAAMALEAHQGEQEAA